MTAEVEEAEHDGENAFGDELPSGTKLLQGQYTIERYLNSGGFGITYLARDSLDRIVVIKECFPSSMCRRDANTVLVRSRSNQEEFESIVKLFGQEARSLAKLQHPNIVGVHQVFEDNDTSYMALDFVEGKDLLDIIEETPHLLTPDVIRTMLEKLLSAVAYIHDRDILHRDISPDNILLDDNMNPVLIDFGAAREEATRASRVLSSLHMVKDGYSPQEFYIHGSKQTLSSDLYALAATFYHAIERTAPPVSQARLAVVAEGKDDPYVPLIEVNRDYDQFFLGAIDTAMEVFPKDRLQSAHDWMDEIDEERRRKAALDKAKQDKQMENAIGKLVNETNQAVEADKAQEKKQDKRRRIMEAHGQLPELKSEETVIPKDAAIKAPAPKTPEAFDPATHKPRRRSLLGRVFSRGNKPPVDKESAAPSPAGKVERLNSYRK